MSAVDVCSDYSPHNKFSWEDAVVRRVPDEGPIDGKTLGLATLLRRSLGTANTQKSHVNVCWRTSANLADVLGCSADTYRRHRDALKQEGLLFSIASGRGPQKILILKHPEESKSEALKTAIGSLSAYRSRTDNPRLDWVFEALRCAYAKHRPGDSAMAEGSATSPSDHPDQMRGSREADANTSQAFITYMKRQQSSVRSSSQYDTNSPPPNEPLPPTHQESSGSKQADIVDFDHIRTFRDQWRQLFESFGRQLDEGCALKLARAYVEEVEEAGRLLDGHFRTPSGGLEAVETRLARLFGDETSTGRVVSYLLEDVDSFVVPKPSSHESPPTVESDSTGSTDNSTQTSSNFSLYWNKLVDAGIDGEEAWERAETKARQEGWNIPNFGYVDST